MANTNTIKIDIDKEFEKDCDVLNKFSKNEKIQAAIRFSCTFKGKYFFPKINTAQEIIANLSNPKKSQFIMTCNNKNFYYTQIKGYYYFAVANQDTRDLIEELNVRAAKFNIKDYKYEFVKAIFNPWNRKTNTTFIFLHVPLWEKASDAEEFYKNYGEINSVELKGNTDLVTYKKINWKLPFLWHKKNHKNKQKSTKAKTKTFQIPNTSLIVKITSKVKCKTCLGYGHHNEACPKEVLPLLQDFQQKQNPNSLPKKKTTKQKQLDQVQMESDLSNAQGERASKKIEKKVEEGKNNVNQKPSKSTEKPKTIEKDQKLEEKKQEQKKSKENKSSKKLNPILSALLDPEENDDEEDLNIKKQIKEIAKKSSFGRTIKPNKKYNSDSGEDYEDF